jgi:lysophospholipase L1-like esterase
MRSKFFGLVSTISLGLFQASCASDPSTSTADHPAPTATAEARSTSEAASVPTATIETADDAAAGARATGAPTGSTAPAAPSASAVAPLPKMKVLVVGDSFAEALGVGLKGREADTGIKFVMRGQKATFIPEWAGSKHNLAGLMVQEKPDLVVIALGGNELKIQQSEDRAPRVKELVGRLGSTPCVWVSPPLWDAKMKDNGLLEVIRKNSAPCRYFDSDVLSPDLPRGGDKIHPTSEGQKKWAGLLLDWLTKEQQTPGATPFALKPRPASE